MGTAAGACRSPDRCGANQLTRLLPFPVHHPQKQLVQRTERVKGVDLHPTEPWCARGRSVQQQQRSAARTRQSPADPSRSLTAASTPSPHLPGYWLTSTMAPCTSGTTMTRCGGAGFRGVKAAGTWQRRPAAQHGKHAVRTARGGRGSAGGRGHREAAVLRPRAAAACAHLARSGARCACLALAPAVAGPCYAQSRRASIKLSCCLQRLGPRPRPRHRVRS
jgi:hypothetical protein